MRRRDRALDRARETIRRGATRAQDRAPSVWIDAVHATRGPDATELEALEVVRRRMPSGDVRGGSGRWADVVLAGRPRAPALEVLEIIVVQRGRHPASLFRRRGAQLVRPGRGVDA